MYNASFRQRVRAGKHAAEEMSMGTCPKCKRRIRKNGNHTKLGSVWFHKRCPPRAPKTVKAA